MTYIFFAIPCSIETSRLTIMMPHRSIIQPVLVLTTFVLVLSYAQNVLYVTPNTSTPCTEEPCRLISEYAGNLSSHLETNTTFLFLPGEHTLTVSFLLFDDTCPNCLTLELVSIKPESSTTITCESETRFYFESLSYLHLSGLVFSSCGSTPLFESIALQFIVLAEVENCTFEDNVDAVSVDHSTLISRGNSFTGTTSGRLAGAVRLVLSNATFTDNLFSDNFGGFSSGAIYALFSNIKLCGTNTFRDNLGPLGGAISAFDSNITVLGSAKFSGNSATSIGGAVLATLGSNIMFQTKPTFYGNTAQHGGAIAVLNAWVEFISGASFESNSADYGGAIYAIASTLVFQNDSIINHNEAQNGGGIFLASNSVLLLASNTSLSLSDNRANLQGGAIFVQDFNPLIYCFTGVILTYANQNCFIQLMELETFFVEDTGSHLYFEDNSAEEAGSVLFGGAIDSCTVISGGQSFPDPEFFDTLVVISDGSAPENGEESSKSISSDPFTVCACSDDSEITCDRSTLYRQVFSGGTFTVSAVAVGQRRGVVPSVIQANNNTVNLGDLELTQRIPSECTELTYTVFGSPGNASVELYAEGPCLMVGTPLTIQVEVLPCPPGFSQVEPHGSCECSERLKEFTDTCSASDGTILRDGEFWVGYDSHSQGLILHPNCPFEYCTSNAISFRVEDSDAQCNLNRVGLLCGSCPDGLSLLLGRSQCDRCSNSYLALLLFFAIAGVLLVAFLLLCKLTVALGSINGLIFYANVIAANKATFFPQQSNGYVDFLRVFISWINLDFGIETCFYDGMDAYAKTWLQFVFPLYIWAIIGFLILLSKFVPQVGRLLGTNPVAVLATLVLLSYAKLLRTIIAAFSSASLEYPEGSELVWLYDGNVRFFGGKHTPLFVVSLLFLLFDFVPYTVLLLTSQWLQLWSDWKILSWLNNLKVRTFLDAYHAPYKPKHRYWSGLLLLVRFAILLTSALNSKVDPGINLIVIGILLLLLHALTWNFGGVYNNWYIEALESFFLGNLGLLTLATFHVQLESTRSGLSANETDEKQVAVVSTLITAALIVFIGIVSVHIYYRLRQSGLFEALKKRREQSKEMELSEPQVLHYRKETATTDDISRPTRTFVALREELLEDTS